MKIVFLLKCIEKKIFELISVFFKKETLMSSYFLQKKPCLSRVEMSICINLMAHKMFPKSSDLVM